MKDIIKLKGRVKRLTGGSLSLAGTQQRGGIWEKRRTKSGESLSLAST